MNFLRLLGAAAVLSLLFLGASCSATGKLRSVGSAPEWRDLPAPSTQWGEPGTIAIRITSPTLEEDEEFASALSQAMLEAARKSGMNITAQKARDKRPQYEVVITESAEGGSFDINEEAGLWGLLGGGVAGGAATQEAEGVAAGAAGGGVLGALALGEKKDRYRFLVTLRQYTDLSVTSRIEGAVALDSVRKDEVVEAAAVSSATQEEKMSMLEKSFVDAQTNSIQMPKMFFVTVEGGSLTSKADRDAAARAVVVKSLPRWIFPTRVM